MNEKYFEGIYFLGCGVVVFLSFIGAILIYGISYLFGISQQEIIASIIFYFLFSSIFCLSFGIYSVLLYNKEIERRKE